MRTREDSEVKRYRAFHQIDLADLTIYDLRIDTRKRTAQKVTASILARLQEVRS